MVQIDRLWNFFYGTWNMHQNLNGKTKNNSRDQLGNKSAEYNIEIMTDLDGVSISKVLHIFLFHEDFFLT